MFHHNHKSTGRDMVSDLVPVRSKETYCIQTQTEEGWVPVSHHRFLTDAVEAMEEIVRNEYHIYLTSPPAAYRITERQTGMDLVVFEQFPPPCIYPDDFTESVPWTREGF